MAKVHIFIDGSWLYKVCVAGDVLARDLVYPRFFKLDFAKLQQLILQHLSSVNPDCTEIGDCYNVTSIFNIPADFDNWVGRPMTGGKYINQGNINRTKDEVAKRESFANDAITAGFNSDTILRVNLKEWMVDRLIEGRFQEKQVDTTVVAMLVKYAITKHDDYFAVIAGDADILPAINIAYPEFTKNVCLVTTHPDEMDASRRQTSFSYTQYAFSISPLYLQQHVKEVMSGNNVYQCVNCRKLFSTNNPISAHLQPHCKKCRP